MRCCQVQVYFASLFLTTTILLSAVRFVQSPVLFGVDSARDRRGEPEQPQAGLYISVKLTLDDRVTRRWILRIIPEFPWTGEIENFSSVESSRRFLALATTVFKWILTDRGWMDGWYIQHMLLQRLRCASTEHRMTMIRGAITWSARGLYKSTMVGIWAGDGPLIAVLHRYGDL